MRKLMIAAVAAIVAATSFATVADARDRGFQWRNGHHGWHQGYRGWRHGYRGWHGRHYGWRHNGWRGRGYWGPGWGPGFGYWGGPVFVIGGPVYDDYCFVKKVRRHDHNGNVYIKRVRVCR